METKIQIFKSPQFGQMRVKSLENEKVWFCLADVCQSLGLGNASQTKSRLKKEGITTNDTPTASGIQQMLFIDEPNLYRCIFQSRKKEAEQFQDWVVDEVLPTIRRTGGYMTTTHTDTPETIMARALLLAQQTIDQQKKRVSAAEKKALLLKAQSEQQAKHITAQEEMIEAHKKHNRQLLPAAVFAKAVKSSGRSMLVGQLAKIIKQNGVEIGQNRLFQWVRDEGFLHKRGESYNLPTQKSMNMALFEIKKTAIVKPNGTTLVTSTPKVTGKGQVYFVNYFIKHAYNQTELERQAKEAAAKKGGAR